MWHRVRLVLPSVGAFGKRHPGLPSVMAAAKEGRYDAASDDLKRDIRNEKRLRDDVKGGREECILTQIEGRSVLGRDRESFRNFPGFVDTSSSPGSSASLAKMDSKYSPGKGFKKGPESRS